MIRLKGRKVSAEVRAFVGWLGEHVGVRHPVDIHVVGKLYGYFDGPGKREGYAPHMVVVYDDGLMDTIAHEIVHYEQWRDGREMNERGVNQRAAALVRQWRRREAA